MASQCERERKKFLIVNTTEWTTVVKPYTLLYNGKDKPHAVEGKKKLFPHERSREL